MSVTFVLLAFVPSLHGSLPTTRWLDDYTAGYKQAAVTGKPLAVIVGQGAMGWNALDAKGSLDIKINQLLGEKYICVYVDANQEQNKELVKQLKVGSSVGLVVSDPSGQYVAFRHTGPMTAGQLESSLQQSMGVVVQPAPVYSAPLSTGYCRT